MITPVHNLMNKVTFARTYRDANEEITTENYIKPLPPKGHLVDDSLISSTKYFFKDIGYDLKSLKNGINGTANDHQLGRLNDVGLRIGGIGIAAYLASKTANKKARIMEYVGLAAFLTSMSVYPKIAINTPAKIVHGFDIDKQYIDDQGRKKSVFQDSNYIPYDMYNGKIKDEDLDVIGDKLGIPRDVKNRHGLVKEQMRKISTQNNTLWMLTAGLATPLMTALICNGLENYVISPALENSQNNKFNNLINEALKQSNNIHEQNSGVGKQLKSVLTPFVNKMEPLPNEEIKTLVNVLTYGFDNDLAESIEKDIKNILSEKVYKIDNNTFEMMKNSAKLKIPVRYFEQVEKNFLPNKDEMSKILSTIKPNSNIDDGIHLTEHELETFNIKLSKFMGNKIQNTPDLKPEFLSRVRQIYLGEMKPDQLSVLTEDRVNVFEKYADALGDLKSLLNTLDKCANYKFEQAPDTILANYYDKFQQTLIKELKISTKDLKKIRDDKKYASSIIDEKIKELVTNEKRYEEVFQKLGNVISKMEIALNGKGNETSDILNLINAYENAYNNTAKRLSELGCVDNTITQLVNQDVGTLGNEIKTRDQLNDLLDSIISDAYKGESSNASEYVKYNSKGAGSSKNIKIGRVISRYSGEMNSFYRILHTLEFYKRSLNPESLLVTSSVKDISYVKDILERGQKLLLEGTISDFTLKAGMASPQAYRDLAYIMYPVEEAGVGTHGKSFVTSSAKTSLEKYAGKEKGNVLERFQTYMTRFRNLVFNNPNDFTKPYHKLNLDARNEYMLSEKTNESLFNLVAQNPVDMLQKGSAKKYINRKWMQLVAVMTGSVFAVTLLSQLGFGKIKKINKKQVVVKNESDK